MEDGGITMESEQIKHQLIAIIGRIGLDITNFTDTFYDMGLDSLDHVWLIEEIEECFNLGIQVDVAEHLLSIQDCVDFIEQELWKANTN